MIILPSNAYNITGQQPSPGETMSRIILIILFVLVSLTNNDGCRAASTTLFKIASLAPAGSVWVEQFENFAKEVSQNTQGAVTFRIYPGGVMGDDQAMYRKMKVGQLQGGGFTMTGISNVVPDFRALAIPFLFTTYDEVDYLKKHLGPLFQERFREKGMELIAMSEVGFIYAMSTKPLKTLEDLKNSVNWSPSGDPISETYLSSLGITPVQLSIPDVLSSLQSGLVETVYNSLYGAIVLQWFTKAKYVVDLPYGYAYGAVALDSRKFNTLTQDQQKAIHSAADKYFPLLLQQTRKSNEESRQVMIERGSEFLAVDEATAHGLREQRDKTIDKLLKGSLSRDVYDRTVTLLKEFHDAAGTKPD